MNPNVLFCDNHILIVDKPADLVTQATEGHATSLEAWAKQWIKKKFQKPGAVFLHPIHRIDRVVSGIVVFARTSKALSRLNESMREGKIEKTYQALVEGKLPAKKGTLEHDLKHGSGRALLSNKGKKSILHYKVLKKEKDANLVEIELETGRYHQIRAQFAAIGCPIVGDKKYGSKQRHDGPGIALRHVQIVFPHPVTKEMIKAECHAVDKNRE